MRTPIPAPVGIDDMAAYLPGIYLPIEALAEARDIEYAKLNKGLGLTAMSLPDTYEDTASLAANAVLKLMRRNRIDPRKLGRIYLGTESSFDGSKPMATYVLQMLQGYFQEEYGKDCFLHTDVVDLTFACIGAVDAFQNTLDWVRGGAERIGIVVASDIAWYDPGSTGEYTQGAGAVALLVKENPRLLEVQPDWGVASDSVHDFFKPLRRIRKQDLLEEAVAAQGFNGNTGEQLTRELEADPNGNWFRESGPFFNLHPHTPVFDGPYSNDCYQERIAQALDHYCRQRGKPGFEPLADWDRLIFHLPYAYQARRMFTDLYLQEKQAAGQLAAIETEVGSTLPLREDFPGEKEYRKARSGFLRAVGKTPAYRAFVAEKIERGERASSLVGNLYTGSIWLSLMSSLEADWQEGTSLPGQQLGFFAYGSGSKSKVFAGLLGPEADRVVQDWGLMDSLEQRQAIAFSDYEHLRRETLSGPLAPAGGMFYLQEVDEREGDTYGTRTYAWAPVRAEISA